MPWLLHPLSWTVILSKIDVRRIILPQVLFSCFTNHHHHYKSFGKNWGFNDAYKLSPLCQQRVGETDVFFFS